MREAARAIVHVQTQEGLKMERSFELKKIGRITEHVERAMRVVDACIAKILKDQIVWCDRSLKTSGIQKTERISDIDWMELYHLAARVQIDGHYYSGIMIMPIQATIDYVGKEGVHDPSGNPYTEDLHIERVRINFDSVEHPNPYTFFKGFIPEEAS